LLWCHTKCNQHPKEIWLVHIPKKSSVSLLFTIYIKKKTVVGDDLFLYSAGLVETSKGCCGSGTIEYGDTCKGMTTCADPSKYAFWDAVHPTEKMYRILADEAIASLDGALID